MLGMTFPAAANISVEGRRLSLQHVLIIGVTNDTFVRGHTTMRRVARLAVCREELMLRGKLSWIDKGLPPGHSG